MFNVNFLVVLLNFCSLCRSEDELIAVTALVRHGARLPESFYPNDPYKNATWPFVLGDLTNEGVEEMFNVGKWLRKEYTPFLSEKYDPDQIYAQSLDYDRCIMSGEATLAGLYPPIGNEIWNKKIRWQPIPIHITPAWEDIVVNMNACPRDSAEVQVILNTTTFKEVMSQDAGFFNYISNHSGQPINLTNLYPLFDTLFSELKLNLPLPEWAQNIYSELLPLVVQYTKMNSLLKVEKRIQIGPILGRILNQFKRAITREDFGTTNTIYRKFMAYFATEWILYDLTYALNLPPINIPDFGAVYLIELKRNNYGTYYVNILYRHSSAPNTKAVPAPIQGQKFNLDFNIFENEVKPLVTNATEWLKLCQHFSGYNITVNVNVPMS